LATILISYRRADSAAIVGRIYDRLIARYGANAVFLDVDGIPAGADFRDHIRRTLERTDVVLAVVGPAWLGATGGHTRMHDDDDPVRAEIEAALAAGTPLCPVLVDGAKMPSAADLPESLTRFPYLNATTVDTGRDFDHHAGRLIAALDAILGPKAPPPPPPPITPLRRRVRVYAAFAIVVALAAGAAAAGIEPPWPAAIWIETAAFGAVAVAAARALLRSARPAERIRAIAVAAVLLVVTASGYLFASSAYVFEVPTTNVRLAKGFVCTPEGRRVYGNKCPNLGLDELREAEYEAGRLWTAQSIAIVRIVLLLLWSTAFAAVAVLVAAASNELRAAGTRP
jgi:hypothetical protein